MREYTKRDQTTAITQNKMIAASEKQCENMPWCDMIRAQYLHTILFVSACFLHTLSFPITMQLRRKLKRKRKQ